MTILCLTLADRIPPAPLVCGQLYMWNFPCLAAGIPPNAPGCWSQSRQPVDCSVGGVWSGENGDIQDHSHVSVLKPTSAIFRVRCSVCVVFLGGIRTGSNGKIEACLGAAHDRWWCIWLVLLWWVLGTCFGLVPLLANLLCISQ